MTKNVLLKTEVRTSEFRKTQLANEEQVLKIMKKEAEFFLKKHFGMNLDIPIILNSRLRTTYGRFRYYRGGIRPFNIEMQTKFVMACILVNKIDILLDVLRHELVHYAMYCQGLTFNDGTEAFESKLKELGVGASMATSSSKVKSFVTQQVYIENVYQCDCCGDRAPLDTSREQVSVICGGSSCGERFKSYSKTPYTEIKVVDYN